MKGKITTEQYNAFKFESINSSKSIDNVIVEHNVISSEELAKYKSEMFGVGFIDLKSVVIPIDTLHRIPAEVAKEYMAIAFEETPTKVRVAFQDPLDLQKVKYVEGVLKKTVEAYYGSLDDIVDIIDTRYGAQINKDVDEALEEARTDNLLDINNNALQENQIGEDNQNAPIIRIVNMVLDYGVKNQASDIHIEPREKKVAVRFRVRGILSEKLTIPRKLLSPVITRIKILSDLKIDEHRIPQDGRFQVKSDNKVVDLRVSVMPSIYGEKVVMRLLAKTDTVLSLEAIGMGGISFNRYLEALKKTQGVILVSGPTGSGKTQTLASSLKILNQPEVNIMTLEDPVEIRIEGVNQVQINPEVGLTFASGLRSFLRQDPDVIMVGEIRDSETANLAIQSALVGRLVLSTVHTNSSAGAFIRLVDMGVEPFLLSSTINLIVGQRLVRVLCDCKKPYEATPEIMKELHTHLDPLNGINLYTKEKELKLHFGKDTDKATLYAPVGCPKCNNTGYLSRTGIFEALKMSENISQAIMQKKTIKEIQNVAISEGMITMVQDGYIKSLEGITTMEEVFRVKNE